MQGLVRDGILRPVESSTWATPLKSNGLPRICGDFRVTVNPHLKQAATTTLDVEDMFQGLQGHACFSKIDLTNAFLQISLGETSKELTTINTMWGLFQYNFLPFDLNVSPAIFQRVINDIIVGIPNVRAYQDDIVIFSKDHKDTMRRCGNFFKLCTSTMFKLMQKSLFFVFHRLSILVLH